MSKRYDVLLVTDCRFPGGNTSSVVEEIRAQSRAGYRTGLLHLPSPSLTRPRPFAPKIRQVLERGEAELVIGTDKIETGLLLARHPSVFTEIEDGTPPIIADKVVLAVNNAPVDGRQKRPHYDVEHVQRQIEHLVGKGATWAPIGPRVRTELAVFQDVVPILPWDWENVIDVAEWEVERTSFVSDKPVIGRHSRGHWSKWPRKIDDLLAAYPSDPRYTVRILGGTETPAQLLGRVPGNWIDHPFGSMPAREFLARIDFLVYFHHPKLIEAFGRVVLEALAAGTVAIVPRYMEALFGDACLYGEPKDVPGYVDSLYSDWDAYLERSRAGVDLVRKRFSYDTHVERIAQLIGDPEEGLRPRPRPAPQPRRRGTVVIDLTAGKELDPLVPSVTRAAVNEGPRVLALPAARAVDIGRRATIETIPRAASALTPRDRRRYLAMRIAGLVEAHKPARLLVIDDGTEAVRDLISNIDEHVASEWRIQPSRTSQPADDPLADVIAKILPPGWGIGPVPPPPIPPPSVAPRRGWSAAVRRRLTQWARETVYAARRRRVVRLKDLARATNMTLFELSEGEIALPVRSTGYHPEPEHLPVTLIVVTDAYANAERTVRAIVERQHVTTGFRVALLAPTEWEPVAAEYGLTIETLVPEPEWATLYGDGWPAYLRLRIDEACRAIGPATVIFADGSLSAPHNAGTFLDVLESVKVRKPVRGRSR